MSDICWFDVYTAACREIVDLPSGWVCCSARALGHPVERKGLDATGAVCPPKTRGPDKGSPNWAKRDRATQRTFFLKFDDVNRVRQRLENAEQSNSIREA